MNEKHEDIYEVKKLDKDGAPLEPEGVNAKWCNDCRVLAREHCKIIQDDWRKIFDEHKQFLWAEIKKYYVFPPYLADDAKIANIKTIGKCLRTFRWELNKEYVRHGLTLFNQFGFITPNKWNTFVN